MNPDSGQAWFRLGVFLVLVSLLILPMQPSGSAEQIVTLIALLTGVSLLSIVIWLVKRAQR